MIKCRLKVLLAEHDITQKELGLKTGIRIPTINAMCNNKIKQIPVEALDKICSLFKCQPNDVFTHIEK